MNDYIKDIISGIGVLVAIVFSIIGLVRSSRQKQNDQLAGIAKSLNDHIVGITKSLNDHILEDEHSITELQTVVKHLNDGVNTKLDSILRELDK